MDTPLLEILPWDSAHLGRTVARIASTDLTDEQLDAVLCEARQQGVGLVYWPAPPGVRPDAGLLNCHGGARVDQKAVFRARLSELPGADCAADAMVFTEMAGAPASPALLELAVAAGRYSRFRVDPRYPQARFVSMYRQWLERSLDRKVADSVLVAHRPEAPDFPLALVTVAVSTRSGSIGLIAVHEDARRQGLAGRLLARAHEFMRQRGATDASVVTQLANTAACRLYERAGYHLAEVTDYFHFWLHPARASAA